jgi:hypothetical protein
MYFGWYFVHDPSLVSRSLAGHHSWVEAFLRAAQSKAEPGAAADGEGI